MQTQKTADDLNIQLLAAFRYHRGVVTPENLRNVVLESEHQRGLTDKGVTHGAVARQIIQDGSLIVLRGSAADNQRFMLGRSAGLVIFRSSGRNRVKAGGLIASMRTRVSSPKLMI